MPRGRPRELPSAPIKLHADLLAMAKAIVGHQGGTIQGVVEDHLRAPLSAMFGELLPAMKKAAKSSPTMRELLRQVDESLTASEIQAAIDARGRSVDGD